ncbi:MAG TPA: DMT family transporter [Opitutaceae bacterium]|nr:DMT family transporter [Opitutaceae bacterium]
MAQTPGCRTLGSFMGSSGHQQRQRAIAMLLLANLFWGLSFPVIKAVTMLHAVLLPGAGTWFGAVYTVAPRFVLAVLLLGLWWHRDLTRLTRLELKQGVAMGLFAAGGMLLQNDGLQFTAASTSAFLTQLYAVLIPVWLALRARRNPGSIVWISCALVLAGVAVLGRFNPFAPSGPGAVRFGRGECETLLSSFFFMGQILWLEKREFAANRPERLTFVLFATEALVFTALALIAAPNAHALAAPWGSPTWVGLTATLTLFCTIAAFLLMNTWQPKITATEAGLIYCIEPIFGSVMALFLPAWFSVWGGIDYVNERLTWSLLVGGGLITLANLVIQLKPPAMPMPAAEHTAATPSS